jgi:serine/threonine protein kinase
VYEGMWRDMRVAIKTVGGGSLQRGSELDREIAMLQTVRHPNIVLFFGAGTFHNGISFLVTELIDLGTLTSVLESSRPIDWPQRTRFAYETAAGMAHVHGLGRMHRDLKSANLLVSSSLHIKIADFGTAAIASLSGVKISPENAQQTHIGSPLWMAPEVLARQVYGPSADVYSFGIVMWEIAARRLPWLDELDDNPDVHSLREVVLSGTRPAVDASWPSRFRMVMAHCWAAEAPSRPSFADVLPQLAV